MTTNAAYHTVSGVFVRILKKHHIRHVFGLPAAQMAMIMDGISRDPYFRYATTRHEEAAGHMAHAVHLVTGEMAMCFGTTGAGAAATGLAVDRLRTFARSSAFSFSILSSRAITSSSVADRAAPLNEIRQRAAQAVPERSLFLMTFSPRSPGFNSRVKGA